jgi:hypothetical protein
VLTFAIISKVYSFTCRIVKPTIDSFLRSVLNMFPFFVLEVVSFLVRITMYGSYNFKEGITVKLSNLNLIMHLKYTGNISNRFQRFCHNICTSLK